METNNVWDIIINVLLASLGGIARILYLKDREKLRLWFIASELFVSGFVGYMVLLLAHASGLGGDWVGLVCGMAGWIGPKVLERWISPALKTVGLDVGEDKKGEGV
jgi:hypothetical protein